MSDSSADKARAYRIVRSAVEAGKLTRPDRCTRCGAEDRKETSGRHTIQAHHHAGYDRPLDVEWLCPRCHRTETPLPATMGAPVFGAKNGASRLTADAAAEIRQSNLGCRLLARKYGVDKKTIQRIRNGTHWLAAAPTPEPSVPVEPWSNDPHAMASELRRVANEWGEGFRLPQLLRDAADQIDTTAERMNDYLITPTPSPTREDGRQRAAEIAGRLMVSHFGPGKSSAKPASWVIDAMIEFAALRSPRPAPGREAAR